MTYQVIHDSGVVFEDSFEEDQLPEMEAKVNDWNAAVGAIVGMAMIVPIN